MWFTRKLQAMPTAGAAPAPSQGPAGSTGVVTDDDDDDDDGVAPGGGVDTGGGALASRP